MGCFLNGHIVDMSETLMRNLPIPGMRAAVGRAGLRKVYILQVNYD